VALPASDVPIVGKSACLCFPARHAGSVRRAMPRDVRSGESGCGRNFFWMSLTVRKLK